MVECLKNWHHLVSGCLQNVCVYVYVCINVGLFVYR